MVFGKLSLVVVLFSWGAITDVLWELGMPVQIYKIFFLSQLLQK